MSTVLAMEGVWFRYRPQQDWVLEDILLSMSGRDFLGLVGPNGGGKTTLLRLILGLHVPSRGSVRVLGQDPRRAARRIGYVPQRAQADESVPHTCREVVLLGRLARAPWGCRFGAADRAAAERAMAQCGVLDLAHRPLSSCSGGQRQRVFISRALAAEAELLILDEPMGGVDVHQEEQLTRLLADLHARLPVILVSHDLAAVSASVDRVACCNRKLTVHSANEAGCHLIHEHYHGRTPLLHLHHHDHACPVHGYQPSPANELPRG